MQIFQGSGVVKVFPGKGGWTYISIPNGVVKNLLIHVTRGIIPVIVTIGSTSFNTSLMPKGDGTHFIPIKSAIRKKENISVGKKISVSFSLR